MTDKPAATGSGEPQKSYVAHKFVASGNGNKCGICSVAHGGDATTWVPDESTPPASQPTVTLDRVDYDEFIASAQRVLDYPDSVAAKIRLKYTLALLRAAEQK